MAQAPKPLITSDAPASANARAMPSPMPLVDPVTRATLPASGLAALALTFVIKSRASRPFRPIQAPSGRCARVAVADAKTARGAGARGWLFLGFAGVIEGAEMTHGSYHALCVKNSYLIKMKSN